MSADVQLPAGSGKVLRFYAYFREGVHERPDETERIRKCNLYYFLEDDTMQVTEPKTDNSGLPQGNLVRRQKVPRTLGGRDFYSHNDFDIGKDIEIFGKVFHVHDCDAFTRYFYSQSGRSLRPKEEAPSDQYSVAIAAARESVNPMKAKDPEHIEFKRYTEFAVGGRLNLPTAAEREAAQKFILHDRKVLRFYCVCNSKEQLYGDYRYFTYLYFLSDGTTKIMELSPPNAGRDPFPVFVKRQKLPKNDSPAGDENLETLVPRPKTFVTDDDLRIGRTVRVFGRDFLLYDCDEFTKQYYRENYGVVDFTPIEVGEKEPPRAALEAPPHHGFGADEDSLSSWKYLVLKPPKRDLKKQAEMDGKILRFGGYLEVNPARRLILCYYLADDTIGIFEQPTRNTGYVGGKFLQRQRVKKPINGLATGTVLRQQTEYYGPHDFHVGLTVCINGHNIVLDKTDERTVAFMEGRPKQFTVSDVNRILKKVRDALSTRYGRLTEAFRALDRNHDGVVVKEEFAQACFDMGIELSEHELITLLRHIDLNHDGVIDYQELVQNLGGMDYCSELDAAATSRDVTRIADKKDLTFSRASNRHGGAGFGGRTLQMFRDKMDGCSSSPLETFRRMTDRAPDGKLGEAEFRFTVVDTLQMNFSEEQMDSLVKEFFPIPGVRLSLLEFSKKIEQPTFAKKAL
eukprot:NODE_189_length_2374_cov_131.883400_g183_i0.p1 GENE.NODE_189_length_2374_cov_131.883400_g183_i0~~NODE_189_length_2374_cov_131.883400_g183_i0.p1  ORF type:complete len:769 (-),score=185.81 NODE_189_length_2374_cov_131.883400_g183_i0:68-2119(-)